MANTPAHPDFLTSPRTDIDPLRSRHGLSAVQYSTPMQRFKRTARRIPDRVLDIGTAFIVGVTFALLLTWRG